MNHSFKHLMKDTKKSVMYIFTSFMSRKKMNIIGNFSTYICEASKAFIILIFLEVIIAPRVQGFKAQNVGMTPTLGLSTVENWGCKINQDLIKKQADLLVSRNLAKAGYDTVLVGCGWYADRRNQDKTMAESTKNFPDKLGKIGDYLHNEKLKFGITQSVGDHPCLSKRKDAKPGLAAHEDIDIKTFADWGVDHVKLELYVFRTIKIHKMLKKSRKENVF
ncbi:glycoside hydrolase superfamily [Phakopsora pachyrhizi]|uniref:Alpha-galactosidase n=1 Tax=Phakopsora pachyrhizi TaxID=170000 RepID=A0AAV0BKX4_PHAPC|nr:glycoside hydrolase superfamily [Phakopsora pachyrhizi]